MRRAIAALRVLALASLLTVALAAPAAAFELNGGCTLDLSSADASGGALDSASGAPGGGSGGTQEDPFLVDWAPATARCRNPDATWQDRARC